MRSPRKVPAKYIENTGFAWDNTMVAKTMAAAF
jgi:hypothetical protein